VERSVPPFIWRISAISGLLPDLLQTCRALNMTWLLLPTSLADDSLVQLALLLDASAPEEPWSLVLGIRADSLRPRVPAGFHGRLAALRRSRIAAALLESTDANEVKAGWPFHRLAQLRDQGVIDLFLAEADDPLTAEWLVEHSPAHAVSVPFGTRDLNAQYRVLPAARELGMALLAAPPEREGDSLPADIAYAAAEPAITSILLDLPADVQQLTRCVAAFRAPTPPDARQTLWAAYQAAHPAPPKPRGGHPPE
jgi:hypothetical protein